MDTPQISERYILEEKVGSGGMGSVYRAKDTVLDITVAIKVLAYAENERHIQRFQLEAKTAGNLKHANVVTVLDFGVSDENIPYLVMEFVEGKTLAEMIKKEGNLSKELVLETALQLTETMQYVHDQSIVHRDLKPSNICFCQDEDGNDTLKILDFGVAKYLDRSGAEAALTTGSNMIGSPAYISPEQAKNKEIDGRADIYSLGCILFHALVGKTPFSSENSLELIKKHIEMPPPKMSSHSDRSFSNEMEALVAKCLKKDPDERYQSMQELHSDLLICLNDQDSDATDNDKTEKKKGVGSIFTSLTLAVILAGTFFLVKENWKKVPPSDKSESTIKREDPFLKKLEENSFHKDVIDRVAKEKLNNDIKDDELIEELKRNSKVSKLDLKKYSITDKSIPSLLALPLVELRVQNTKISANGLKKLAALKTLRHLTIGGEQANDEVLKELASLDLYGLVITDCAISDQAFNYISQMTSLNDLQLRDVNGIIGSGLSQLKFLHSLERLSLKGTNFDYNNLVLLKDCPKLNYISLRASSFKDKDAKYLTELDSIVDLNLSKTMISEHALLSLTKMNSLKKVNLEGCKNISDSGLVNFKIKNKDRIRIKQNKVKSIEDNLRF